MSRKPPRHHRRLSIPSLLVVLLVWPLVAATGCQRCSERAVNPESPEEAARIWGKLLCDMRESRVTLTINDFENQHGAAIVRAQLVSGDVDGETRARFYGELNDFIEEHGREIIACEHEVSGKREGENGRVIVDLAVDYQEIVLDAVSGEPSLTGVSHSLSVQTTQLDGAWLITAEPANTPGLDDFVLIQNPDARAH